MSFRELRRVQNIHIRALPVLNALATPSVGGPHFGHNILPKQAARRIGDLPAKGQTRCKTERRARSEIPGLVRCMFQVPQSRQYHWPTMHDTVRRSGYLHHASASRLQSTARRKEHPRIAAATGSSTPPVSLCHLETRRMPAELFLNSNLEILYIRPVALLDRTDPHMLHQNGLLSTFATITIAIIPTCIGTQTTSGSQIDIIKWSLAVCGIYALYSTQNTSPAVIPRQTYPGYHQGGTFPE